MTAVAAISSAAEPERPFSAAAAEQTPAPSRSSSATAPGVLFSHLR